MPIRTPDQRVRVFVSSTLEELAPERAAARQAIERLRLTPVLFELGARPYPPGDLYRAYPDQSSARQAQACGKPDIEGRQIFRGQGVRSPSVGIIQRSEARSREREDGGFPRATADLVRGLRGLERYA